MVDPDSPVSNDKTKTPAAEGSALMPFRHQAFAVLWTATVVSNVGVWMQSAASGWLMTSLNPDPFIVSLVQVATALPMFLFSLPAGGLADIIDRRRLLVWVQLVLVGLTAGFAIFVWLGRVTPEFLLTFTFLSTAFSALITPAWQAIVPQLVPQKDLQSAVALNSVGLNVSRAVGPALAGFIISLWGIAAPFCVNALSTVGVIGGLIWWRPPDDSSGRRFPPERFYRAVGTGLRHARYNPHLRATLVRAAGFFVFASAYWALLPLIARDQIKGDPELYGLLLGAIGLGAVAGAFTLPFLKRRFGPNRLVAGGTVGTALAMVLFALAREPSAALIASLIAGVSWIAVLATINVSAQVALPSWVRGRGLAIYGTVMFGSLSLGSAVWGKMAALTGLPAAHFIAAAGALIFVPLSWHSKLQTGADFDLTPSTHWPEPTLSRAVNADDGPILVTVEYQISLADRAAFLRALFEFADERRRDGAFDWQVFEDTAQEGRFIEAFMLDSWADHLRQHERVTQADRELQLRVNRFQKVGEPKVTHFRSCNDSWSFGDESAEF